jgi:hypothetical protein
MMNTRRTSWVPYGQDDEFTAVARGYKGRLWQVSQDHRHWGEVVICDGTLPQPLSSALRPSLRQVVHASRQYDWQHNHDM